MDNKERVKLSIQSLKTNKLISEIEMFNSDECVGIKDGEIYLTITHHFDLMNDEIYNDLCNKSKIDSVDCVDRETREYETQLVF